MKVLGLSVFALISFSSLLRCPHSKVEESFNLQATHDLYYYGLKPALKSLSSTGCGSEQSKECASLPYDHLQYPGVVPRTFAGPLILSLISRLMSVLLRPILDLETRPLLLQCLNRLWLLLFNLHAHYRLAKSLNSNITWNRYIMKGSQSFALSGYFLIITAAQFHIPFYASRMLPNTFALVLVTHAYAEWIARHYSRTLVLLVASTAIFRCDILLLLFTIGLTLLLQRKVSVVQCIWLGIMTGVASLLITVPFDSVLWQRMVWPEGEVLMFNTVENRSNEYGTSPWHWYGSSAIPKAMLGTLLLFPLGLLHVKSKPGGNIIVGLDYEVFGYLAPVLGFVTLYSILPHKEVRFIFVALPLLNCIAAKGMHILHCLMLDTYLDDTGGTTNQRQSMVLKYAKRILFCGGLGAILLTLLGSQVFVAVSEQNYPGGDALLTLSKDLEERSLSKVQQGDVHVYVDVASAMSGAMSLFGIRYLEQSCIQRETGHANVEGLGESCKVSKGGYEEENANKDYEKFDFMLSEKDDIEGYNVKYSMKGYPRPDIKKFRIINEDAIHVLERQ